MNHPDEGIRRTFHVEEVSAFLEVTGSTWTPADVEGLTIVGGQLYPARRLEAAAARGYPTPAVQRGDAGS